MSQWLPFVLFAFVASITPGPPPVITAKPASAKRFPISRAA